MLICDHIYVSID